mmetsp:Transcript_9300/g.22844  ORF Transcript_9300/g.22844 Transcript_9300/m.22844 type:complete len:1031 (+) Transcript_9300:184-3276(+)
MLSSPSMLLGLSMLALFGAISVLSAPEDEYTDWFSRRDAQPGGGSSSIPHPPGVGWSEAELRMCVFDNVVAFEEEDSIVLLNETLVVDGCLLDCSSKILHSTVREGSIVTVRNGGRVKNCKVSLIKEKQLEADLALIDGIDGIDGGDVEGEDIGDDASTTETIPPTFWGTHIATSESSQISTYWGKFTNYIPNTVAGFLCDQGDCVLDDSGCAAPEFEEGENVPNSVLVMRECVLVSYGATDVRIEGGLTEKGRAVSMYGIAVDAGNYVDSSSVDAKSDAKARLFVNGANIQNQLGDGIVIVGGANTVRITGTRIFGNERNGIQISGGHGLSFFALMSASVELNRMNGIHIFQYEIQPNSTQQVDGGGSVSVVLPTATEVFISDVNVKANELNGLMVERVDDIAIDDATFDENGHNGIYVTSATTISLQGVVSRSNDLTGLSIEAENSIVEIANSIFSRNGKGRGKLKELWQRAGVYLWLPKKVAITNSASNKNAMDGILVYDVPELELEAVDTMKNGNNGVQIRETNVQFEHDYTANSDYLVGAYYYPWHGDDFHDGGGYLRKELTPPQSPVLGEYDDSDPNVISQHLEWFRKSNIGLIVASWWGPERTEDDNIRNVIMQHEYIGNLKIALHYETTSRIINQDDDDMLVPESDIEYMCEHYFDHPNYYKIDGRPVLVIYLSRKLERLGTLESAMLTMRSAANKCGHDLYLIGDAVFADAPEVDDMEPSISFQYFDAVTNYDVYGSSGSTERDTPYAGKEAVDAFYAEQEKWRDLALEEDCRYIPPVSPGYNDRGVRIANDNQPLSRRLTESSKEGSLFQYQLEKALALVDPEVDNLVLVNSFNEWHEDTQIEPIKPASNSTDFINYEGNIATEPEEFTFGIEYVGYGELYLDILRNATSRTLVENEDLVKEHKPHLVNFTDVRSCKNEGAGVRFYIPDTSFDDNLEFIFRPGDGVISCQNQNPDYEFLGGGNLNMQFTDFGITGDRCANGIQALECDLADLLINCEKRICRPRDIVTTSGYVIDDRKIQ